ncbi:FxsA family protein [Motiliproteus sp. MSK22-1]|uniref:FxsA family protein n=1 Tax=Motiliproteus sp. MSK22-1 TaxID=1897630 RepID=UPI0009755FF4|nr:FxsA family protein [Motiliproteus sp. MSK22-1]OMH30341.1 biotin--acetyl-CoA-carboxylase ligase [Motiliproteus sp. MSK22-1]
MRVLFLIFVIVPIIEIVLLINVGEIIGVWYTVGLVLLSAFVGVNMLRHQGLSTLMRARAKMNGGEIPAHEMIEGLILAVGGALLVTPGFVTDFFGFCCLIPVTRRAFVARLQKHFTVAGMQHSHFSASQGPFSEANHQGGGRFQDQYNPNSQSGSTIDGEYRRDD